MNCYCRHFAISSRKIGRPESLLKLTLILVVVLPHMCILSYTNSLIINAIANSYRHAQGLSQRAWFTSTYTHVSIYTRTHTQTNFKLVELERVDSSTSSDGSTASELKGPALLAISCSQDLNVSGFTQTSFYKTPSITVFLVLYWHLFWDKL